MEKRATCNICCQILGERKNDLISNLLGEDGYVRRVILESKNLAVIPSLGPVAPGHVLLCPKVHLRSFAALSGKHREEAGQVVARLRRLLEDTYGEPVHLFEHGMVDGGRVVCTVDHAHLHLVPSAAEVFERLRATSQWCELSLKAGDCLASCEKEYLYYCSPEGRALIREIEDEAVESQFFRKLFAGVAGDSTWDWRAMPAAEAADGIFRRLTFSLGRMKGIPNLQGSFASYSADGASSDGFS